MNPKKNNPANAHEHYVIEEENGRFYVYLYRIAPIKTLFEVSLSKAQAEQAIEDHKNKRHSTQEGRG